MAIDQRIILVSPLTVLARLTELVPTLDFWGAIGYSLVRISAGFLLGVAAGTLLAALSARFRRVEELLAPALLAIKSIPVASFIILALILFSSKNLAVLIVAVMKDDLICRITAIVHTLSPPYRFRSSSLRCFPDDSCTFSCSFVRFNLSSISFDWISICWLKRIFFRSSFNSPLIS